MILADEEDGRVQRAANADRIAMSLAGEHFERACVDSGAELTALGKAQPEAYPCE